MNPVKLHKPLLDVVKNGLDNIFNNGSYADKEVQKILRSNKQFGSKDRSFIAETIYDIVRWKRNYELKLESVGMNSAAEDDSLILISLLNRNYTILNPEILSSTIEIKDPDSWRISHDPRPSFPEWLDERCFNELGDEWNKISEALNIPAKIYIRANTLKTSAEELMILLEAEQVSAKITSPFIPLQRGKLSTCIEILSKNNLRNSKLYKEGLFEFQDIGSQIIGVFCDAQPHQAVLDLCAGAGGKSLQLSALMKNTGTIYATDYNPLRLENLEKRARHAGCRNIEIISYNDAKKLINMDVLLIDAPCSGLGTIKRHPDIKWKLKDGSIEKYMEIQSGLLENHKHRINAKGKIIYATCSILPSESEAQIKKMMTRNPQLILKRELRIQPHLYNSDGYYMAEIRDKL